MLYSASPKLAVVPYMELSGRNGLDSLALFGFNLERFGKREAVCCE